MEIFERFGKMELFSILGFRFAAGAILAQKNFWRIFGVGSIFDPHIARNLDFSEVFKNARIVVNHTSKWAKSDRNSLIWLKMNSERSSQKQHFFSHFKPFQLKMRCKIEDVGLNFNLQCKNGNKDGKSGF